MEPKLLTGTLDLLILETLSHGAGYGYQISQEILARSHGYFELKEGSLYPALHRMERQNLLKCHWEEADGRRRKYYKLTAAGSATLENKRAEWSAFAIGVEGVLGADRLQTGEVGRGLA